MNNELIEVKIDTIVITDRFRQDIGDVKPLAQSIRELGQLQPIGITPDNRLLFGERRIRALRYLGKRTVLARVINVGSLLEAEFAENEFRKEFTASERVAIGKALELELGERRGRQRAHPENPQNFADLPIGDTRDEAAKRAGFNNHTTYEQAKAVVEEGASELVAAMDAGEVAISAAAHIATLPVPEQRAVVSGGAQSMKATAKKIRESKKKVVSRGSQKRKTLDEEKGRDDEHLNAVEEANARLRAELALLTKEHADLVAEYNALSKIVASDDRLAAAVEHLDKMQAANRLLEERVADLTAEMERYAHEVKSQEEELGSLRLKVGELDVNPV